MKVITFSLHTEQPLLATSFQGDPNSDVSYSYIPGSMIRGAIIGRYMRQHNLSELNLSNDEVSSLFFDANSTRYLNAYLLSQEKKRTLPVPLSWSQDKDATLPSVESTGDMSVYDRAVEDELPEEITPKRVEQQFCTVNDESVVLYSVARRINIHNQRDRKKGRSVDNQGEIFRYDAIDAGQTFQAVILCEDTDAAILDKLLEEPNLWLGGSQSAGYGQTKIRIKILDDWNETGIAPNKRENKGNLTITLLSDTLLRNEHGQLVADPTLIKQAVEEVLNRTLPLPKPGGIFASSTLIGGFNRKWGLPLPQVPGLAAGTVVVFKNVDLNSAQIQQLETQGIGDRRAEGFGRIVVNWLEASELQARLPNPLGSSNRPSLRSEASHLLAEQMAERLLQQKLEQELQKKVGYLTLEEGISNSQLSRLELVARQALPTGDYHLVLSLINNLPSNATNQFERTKIGTKNFKEQLDEWLKNPTSWISNLQDLEVRIADVERKLDDERAKQDKLAEKYTLRLIMAVAKKAKEKN